MTNWIILKDSIRDKLKWPAAVFTWFLLLTGSLLHAQTVIGGLQADTSAQLDVQSRNRGFLLPRLTLGQRDSIIEPAEGLQLYNTTTHCLEMNTGTPQRPVWTPVSCRGTIGSLGCADATLSSPVVVGSPVMGVVVTVPYGGGNGGMYGGEVFLSSGVTGLTASLEQGRFTLGAGSVEFTLSGIASSAGTAEFELELGGQICSVEVLVEAYASGADTCGAYIAPGVWQPFLCHNLASANTSSDPQTPGWEQNGGYWQWGRKGPGQTQWLTVNTAEYAHGPTGPGADQTNESAIGVWSATDAPTSAWDEETKTGNDPCPSGFRVPPQAVWEGVLAHNAQTAYGSWTTGPSNYESGRAFGTKLLLPAAGYRYVSGGWLIYRGSEGRYWSSTAGTHLELTATEAATGTSARRYGYSVRCMSETTVGQIGGLNCGGVTSSANVAVDEPSTGISLSIPYTSGNGGPYQGQVIVSNGVSGLSATLSGGTFSVGSGTLTLNLTGTPQQAGTATFALTIGGQSCSVAVPVSGGYPEGYVHCDPDNPTEVNPVTNPITGKTWMDRNLGASRVATSKTDAQAYGDLYQWGRFADGHQCRNSGNTTSLSNTPQPNHGKYIISNQGYPHDWVVPQINSLWQGLNGTNNPCPEGYRIPTRAEWIAEEDSWPQAGAMASPLKLPFGGWRIYWDGEIEYPDARGTYWAYGTDGYFAYFLNMNSIENGRVILSIRGYARSVRCIMN